MNEQQILATINMTLAVLQGLLPQLTANKLAPEIIALVEAAINNLVNVVGTDVTYGQLEGLRTKPLDNAPTPEPKTTS